MIYAQISTALHDLTERWTELAEFYRALAESYTDEVDIGHANGAADAFESAGRLLQSIRPSELYAITRHFSDVARIYAGTTELQKDAITREVSDYGRVYGRGKSEGYIEVLRTLASLNTRFNTDHRANYPRYIATCRSHPETDFSEVHEAVSVLDAELALHGVSVVEEHQHGRDAHEMTLRFALRVPSEDVLNEFIQRAGKAVHLTDWEQTTRQDVYYTGHWVIDQKGILYASQDVFEIAFSLNCALHVSKEMDDCGYKILRFVLRAPSEAEFKTFESLIPKQLALGDWREAQESDFRGVMHPFGTQIYTYWVDGMIDDAIQNQLLLDKLTNTNPIHIATDWRVPSNLSPRWIRSVLLPIYQRYHHLGADLRYSPSMIDEEGYHVQRLIVRFYPEAIDIDKFKAEMLVRTDIKAWFNFSMTEFAACTSLITRRKRTAERDLAFSLYRQSKANSLRG